MRIDINTSATNAAEQANNPTDPSAAGKLAGVSGARSDTAEFLLDRIRSQALAPEPAQQVEGGKARIEALRKAVAEGTYRVAPADVAGALFAESTRRRD